MQQAYRETREILKADGIKFPDATNTKTFSTFSPKDVQTVCEVWRRVSSVPALAQAVIASDGMSAAIKLATIATDQSSGRAYQLQIPLPHGKETCGTVPGQTPTLTEQGASTETFVSPSGNHSVRFHSKPKAPTEGSSTVELWSSKSGKLTTVIIPKSVHESVLQDVLIQNVQWSEDETSIVYIANLPQEIPTLPWQHNPAPGKDEKEMDTPAANIVRDIWGEQYAEDSHWGIFFLDFVSQTVKSILPSEFTKKRSAANPVLLEKSEKILEVAFLAFNHDPVRISSLYCTDTPNQLFKVRYLLTAKDESDPAETIQVTEHTFTRTIKSLHRRPKSKEIVALAASDKSPAHLSCLELVKFDLDNVDESNTHVNTLVSAIEFPETQESFPGFYGAFGIRRELNWAGPNVLLVLSFRRTGVVVYRLRIEGDKPIVPELIIPSELREGDDDREATGVWSVEAIRGSAALFAHTQRNVSFRLFYCRNVEDPIPSLELVWESQLDALGPSLSKCLRSHVTRTLRPYLNGKDLHGTELILTCPPVDEKASSHSPHPPTLVFLHGGPHASDPGSFSREFAMAMALGYQVLSINFGGSLGFGQGRVDELLGHVGEHDVEDVLNSIEWAAQADFIDPTRLVGSGGSHGGFLCCHLSACEYQGKPLLRAMSARNPATFLSAMVYLTDIPYWIQAESGSSELLSRKELVGQWTKSPINTAHRVHTPSLISLGKEDLRVPPTQGQAWVRAVRLNTNVEVLLMRYQNTNHSLGEPTATSESQIMSMLFFGKHLLKTINHS